MTYEVEWRASAQREYAKLDRLTQARIARAVDRLAIRPRPAGARKLLGHVNIWRVRVGDFRVLYAIQDKVLLVTVVSVGNRRDVYR